MADLDLNWMKEAMDKNYKMEDTMIRASRKAGLTRNQLLDTLFEKGVLEVYNLGMKHMHEYLEGENEKKETYKKWYSLKKDGFPKLNELVEVKIIVDGEVRCYLDQFMQTKDGKYRWLYNYYGNAEISWSYI
jgi:hypothetical protein